MISSYPTYIEEGLSTYTGLFRYVLRSFVYFCELILDDCRTVETRNIIMRRRISTINAHFCVTVSVFSLFDKNMNYWKSINWNPQIKDTSATWWLFYFSSARQKFAFIAVVFLFHLKSFLLHYEVVVVGSVVVVVVVVKVVM